MKVSEPGDEAIRDQIVLTSQSTVCQPTWQDEFTLFIHAEQSHLNFKGLKFSSEFSFDLS